MEKKTDSDEFLQELSFNPMTSGNNSYSSNTTTFPVKNRNFSSNSAAVNQEFAYQNSDDENLNPEATKQKLTLFYEKLL